MLKEQTVKNWALLIEFLIFYEFLKNSSNFVSGPLCVI